MAFKERELNRAPGHEQVHHTYWKRSTKNPAASDARVTLVIKAKVDVTARGTRRRSAHGMYKRMNTLLLRKAERGSFREKRSNRTLE